MASLTRRCRVNHDWQISAPCASVDPELWFPETGEPTATAKRICATCEYTEPCLQIALEHPEVAQFGVWGGLSYRQLRAVRLARKQAAA
jgi:WhiB family redox-sensing transcriptional regulator